jgi:hypothetical protein
MIPLRGGPVNQQDAKHQIAIIIIIKLPNSYRILVADGDSGNGGNWTKEVHADGRRVFSKTASAELRRGAFEGGCDRK